MDYRFYLLEPSNFKSLTLDENIKKYRTVWLKKNINK